MKLPVLYIIIPVYNEEVIINESIKLFSDKLNEMINNHLVYKNSKILFVNDGSTDNTWEIIKDQAKKNSLIQGISLSINRGQQNALLAGLIEAKDKCNVTITIDADCQDDLNAIDEMIKEYNNGSEIVYGARNSRDTDSFFKKTTAILYYKLLKWLGADIIYNHSEFRLVSCRVLKEFENYKEVNLFLRGLFPTVGFKNSIVYYKRQKRIGGKTHYSLAKMFGLALNGITSFSIKPIRIITQFGILMSFFSFVMIIWVFYSYFANKTVPGWSTQVAVTCLLGGIQLISLGVIGEYIGKIYLETKHRPRYIIAERINNNSYIKTKKNNNSFTETKKTNNKNNSFKKNNSFRKNNYKKSTN